MAAMSLPQGFPVLTKTLECTVAGCPTHIMLSGYADRVLVVVTQVGTLGSIMQAEKETVLGGGSTYRIDTLIGRRDDPMLELCVRQLAEQVAAAGCERPLMVCLGLKTGSSTLQAVRQIVKTVLENPVW